MESSQSRAQKQAIVIVQLASGLVHDIVVCSESQSDRTTILIVAIILCATSSLGNEAFLFFFWKSRANIYQCADPSNRSGKLAITMNYSIETLHPSVP